jgi:hypothetical protein
MGVFSGGNGTRECGRGEMGQGVWSMVSQDSFDGECGRGGECNEGVWSGGFETIVT